MITHLDPSPSSQPPSALRSVGDAAVIAVGLLAFALAVAIRKVTRWR